MPPVVAAIGAMSAAQIGALAVAAAGAASQYDASRRQKNQAKDAANAAQQQAQQAEQQAQREAQQADMQFNRANQRRANDAGTMPGGAGNSTLLTGPGGVDPSALTLGKNTLLGQ